MPDKKNLQYKIKKLESLLDLSKLLNSTPDTNFILDSLLKESLSFIDGGDIAVIFLFNEDTGYLEPKSYFGFGDEIQNIRILPGESITGKTFKEKKSLFLKNLEEVNAYMENMRESNISLLSNINATVFPKVKSSISCPLMYQENCFGAIVIDGFRDDIPLTNDDLDLLESISVQASIAINNAQNLEKEIKQSNSLQRFNKIIEYQKEELEFALELNNKLTSMLLKGCNIQDVLLELKNLIKLDIFILNPFFKLRNSSITDPMIESLIKRSRLMFSKVLKSRTTTSCSIDNSNINVDFYPFRNNLHNLGWLGVVYESNNNMTSRVKQTIEGVITILTLELMKEHNLNAMEIKHKGDFFDSLITFENVDYINKMASSYGFNTEKEHVLILLSVRNIKDNLAVNDDLLMQNIYLHYSREFTKKFTNTISLLKGHQIIFIVEINKVNKSKINKTTLEETVYRDKLILQTFVNNKDILIGVSNPMKNLSHFNSCYNNALQTIKLNTKINSNCKIGFYSDFKIKKLFLNNDIEFLKSYVDEVMGNILNYPHSSKQVFLDTLKIYIKSNGNWSYTKEVLFIHGNTLSYRLKRIQEILNLNLDVYEDRLKIQLSLEILEILEA